MMNPRRVHELMQAFPPMDAQRRDWVNLVESDGTVRTTGLAHLIGTHIPGTDLLVSVSRKIGNYLPRDAAILFIAEHVGQGEIKITDRQFQGFVLVASNGAGTGWSGE